MRGVTQRVEGWPEGECVRAAYATILGLPIDAIPRLDPLAAIAAGQTQSSLERRFLRDQGYELVEIAVDPPEEIPDEILDEVPRIPHLMSGLSPRGTHHRCVGMGGRVIWDPHPSRAGLVAVHAVGFLVPKAKTS